MVGRDVRLRPGSRSGVARAERGARGRGASRSAATLAEMLSRRLFRPAPGRDTWSRRRRGKRPARAGRSHRRHEIDHARQDPRGRQGDPGGRRARLHPERDLLHSRGPDRAPAPLQSSRSRTTSSLRPTATGVPARTAGHGPEGGGSLARADEALRRARAWSGDPGAAAVRRKRAARAPGARADCEATRHPCRFAHTRPRHRLDSVHQEAAHRHRRRGRRCF